MTKDDLSLICSFTGSEDEMEYVFMGEDGIYATDSKVAIHFSAPMLNLDLLLHKKVLKGFISSLKKDDTVRVDGKGYLIAERKHKLYCDTWLKEQCNVPNFKGIFNVDFEYKMSLEDIDDIHFELAQRDCFIDEHKVYPLIQFSDCNRYEIFFNKQEVTQETTNTGIVKIIGIFQNEEEEIVKFTAIIKGREFKTKTQEQLLLNM